MAARAIRTVAFSMTAAIVLGAASLAAVTVRRSDEVAVRPNHTSGVARARASLANAPLHFIQNKGQLDSRVEYYVPGADTSLFFTKAGVTLALSETAPQAHDSAGATRPSQPDGINRWIVRQEFVGANPAAEPNSQALTPAKVSYFKGSPEQWKTGLPTHSSVVYRDLWPGIDLTYEGTGGRLKYTFVARPGADPSMIRLAYRGATSVRLNAAGQLDVRTPVTQFADDRPVAWQETAGGRRSFVSTAYEVGRGGRYGFKVGRYDRSRPLVIDPVVLIYAGYIGGSSFDQANDIAVANGAAYLVGATSSSAATFPEKVGPDLSPSGDWDAFVAKVKTDGTGLIYAGFIGGSGFEIGNGIAVLNGAAYIVGATDSTQSSSVPFPVLGGPDLTHNGDTDAFVARVKPDGTGLDYAGFIGGSDSDWGSDAKVDIAGFAYVAGSTDSTQATFPDGTDTGGNGEAFDGVPGPDQVHGGGQDGFIARVSFNGTTASLAYAGYIGGSLGDVASGIALVCLAGNSPCNTSPDPPVIALVTGTTQSTQGSFPVDDGPDLDHNGGDDAFVARVQPGGAAFDYSGYIGGSGLDRGNDIAVDSSGAAYVTGAAGSGTGFPTIMGPDVTFNGDISDAFVAKVAPDGKVLVYSGFIGGSGAVADADEEGRGIAIDATGSAYITGYTNSTESDATPFPVKGGPDLTHNGEAFDAFVSKVNPRGTGLDYSGYIGGAHFDRGNAIAVEGSGVAYVGGETSSTQATFPDKAGPDLTHNGDRDGFVAKIVQRNLLKNGDFELDANGDNRPDHWTSNPRFTRTSELRISGFAGKHQDANNSNYTIQQAVAVSAGKRYTFDGFVNIPPTEDQFTFTLQIRWRNKSGRTISTNTIKTFTDSTHPDERPSLIDPWNLASANLRAPSGATSALVRMVVSNLNATIYVDRFLLS